MMLEKQSIHAALPGMSIVRGMKALQYGSLLHWTPRILGLLFAAFISVFALEAFQENREPWQRFLSFAANLLPAALVLVILALAWRWEWIGAVLYPGLGVFYMLVAWGRFPWSVYFVIAGPLFVLGGLFLANWIYRRRPSAQATA
jgi:hypothetical protein